MEGQEQHMQLHRSTKFNFCFVPRTSMIELSSTFYAEFRHVNRIFFIGQGFKDTEEFKCAKYYFACS
jgi:hypothetical protein